MTKKKKFIHFSVENANKRGEIGWLKVTFNAATETSFEIRIPKENIGHLDGYTYIIKKLCFIIPIMMKLDGDFMESADGADVKISNYEVQTVKNFASDPNHEFREVFCALPGFDQM